MNYIKIHNEIIERARKRQKPDCYTEKHHVIPKSMGGDDVKENIVTLTAREHFIIHWLLAKIHNNNQMVFALFSMTKPGNSSQNRYTSHSFRYTREKMAEMMSRLKSGERHHLYGVRGEENPNFGSKRSEETRKRIALAATGRRSSRARRVINIDTGERFESVTEAKLKFRGNVSYALKTGGTANGFRFKYDDESEWESSLKGVAKGSNHAMSVMVVNKTTGQVFETIKDAAKSIGKTGSAISWAIKNNREICGFKFERLAKCHSN